MPYSIALVFDLLLYLIGALPGTPALAEPNDKAAELNKRVARLYRAGKYAEATVVAHRILAIREKALGPEHPHVAASLNLLAEVHSLQGRHGEAEPLLKRALAIREKALGPEHPHATQTRNNLAKLYRLQGRNGEAEALLKR